ncbi:MAG: hypothetical protein AMXMBFR64_59900 [Myxococcales bacterium]
MTIPVSLEVKRIFSEAEDMAMSIRKPLHSGWLLLALYTVPNKAHQVLADRGLDEDVLSDALRQLKGPQEATDTFARLRMKMQQIADGAGASLCSSMHLLISLCRISGTIAYRMIQKAGVDPAMIRTAALARLSAPQRDAWGPRPLGVRATGPVPQVPDPSALERMLVAPVDPDRLLLPQDDADEQAAEPEPAPASRYALDPEQFPMLTQLGRNLSIEAEEGRIDPLVGRAEQLNQILDILHKRRANNACLVGDPGVGKTAIVEGLAQALVARDGAGGALSGRVIVELNTASLLAGTSLRGSFAEKLGAIKEEVRRGKDRVVIFIDEIHTIIGAGAGDGPLDASNDLKSALARGEFPCIGATTMREYKKHIEGDPALERRFQPVIVPEPSQDEARRIIDGLVPRYEDHHAVTYHPDALAATVRLSARYITDRCLPDKAVNVLDLAGARVRRSGRAEVTELDIAQVVSSLTDVPVEKLMLRDGERLLAMESFLRQRIVGHVAVLERIARVIHRNYAGFSSSRPIGSFLFLGPTGVGKTETVRALAEFLFQSRDAIARFDMSEFSESHAVAKLIGSPPGYVGHDAGGQLTEALHKRPYQILLLDEIEKAHADVWNLLLQVLDEGRLTDGRGKRVDFSNAVVIMTSNLGADAIDAASRPIGFGSASPTRGDAALGAAARALPPELWNRIDEKLVFQPLTRADVVAITRLLLADSSRRLEREKRIRYEADESVVSYLIDHGGWDARYGARPMRHTVQRLVEAAVAEAILRGGLREGATAQLTADPSGVTLVPLTESTS